MGQIQPPSLDQIFFENVSVFSNSLAPVLQYVDFEIPMDQTVIVQSSNPTHAVSFLEILAGRKVPQSGRILWNELDIHDLENPDSLQHQLVGCYFENLRPHPEQMVIDILQRPAISRELVQEAVEHFDLSLELQKPFKALSYESQKLVLLIVSTLKNPQMLILEDPAVGLSEKVFLDFLDWVQRSQRFGHIRHMFLTNNHPAATRHLDAHIMHLEDGLIYFEENQNYKKAVHF